MGIIKKALHSKIDVFVKFESAINMEIKDQIKKKLNSFLTITAVVMIPIYSFGIYDSRAIH